MVVKDRGGGGWSSIEGGGKSGLRGGGEGEEDGGIKTAPRPPKRYIPVKPCQQQS